MSSLDALLATTQRRQRLADAAVGLARWGLPAGLFIAAGALALIRAFDAPTTILWLTAVPVPAILGWALLRPRSLRATARKIDEHYGLEDQLGSAYELRTHQPRGVSGDDQRTAEIVRILTARGEELASDLDPRPVVPLRVPGPRALDAIALACTAAALLVPRPSASSMQTWTRHLQLPVVEPGARSELDLALADPLRQSLRDLSRDDEDEAAKAAAQMLEILERLESGELDRAAAFEELLRLEELLARAEEELQAQQQEDPSTLAEAMRELAEALQEHEITQEAGEKFEHSRPEEAQAALDEAAEQAEEAGGAEDEAMRKAMQQAERRLDQAAKQASDTAKQLDEAERRLRREQKKNADDQDPEERERRLKKMQERVEELRRKHEREMAAQRRLEQLRRNAADAAKKGQSAGQRKRSVQKLSRGAAEALRNARQASRMRQAQDAVQEAKTFVRRAGKQGEGANRRRQQFRKFSKAAQGQGKDGKGKGKGDKGDTTLLVEGEVGEGPPQMMFEGDGEGQDGQGQDGQGQDGQGQGQDGQGQDGQGQDGQGISPGGDGIGQGSVDPQGEDSSIDANHKNVHVRTREGRGVSRAEIIRQSSQEGFATEAYRDMYIDYRSFAQSALDNEALPPAKRRTVKRYYQLIQPRD